MGEKTKKSFWTLKGIKIEMENPTERLKDKIIEMFLRVKKKVKNIQYRRWKRQRTCPGCSTFEKWKFQKETTEKTEGRKSLKKQFLKNLPELKDKTF